jgi:lysophospholipase L1-like esterase
MANSWFDRNPKKTICSLLIIGFLLTAYGAEKLLKYKNQGSGFNYALPHRAIRLREYRPSMIEFFRPGQEERYFDSLVLKKYVLRIDQDGFIIPSKKYDNPDISMVFLGGSTTECRFMDEKQRFPYLTGALLEKKLGIKINSYNAARSGNHSLHSIDILLNKVMPIKPQIVLMMENINDLVILLYEKSYWSHNSSRSVIIDMNDEIVSNFVKIIRDRYIPNLAAEMHGLGKSIRSLWKSRPQGGNLSDQRDEFAQVRGKKLVINKSELTGQFEMNLQCLIYLCKARNIVPVLMTMASRLKETPDKVIADGIREAGLDYVEFKGLFDAFNDAIRQKALENQVRLIDLAKGIPPEREYFYDVVHHNPKGSVKAAEIISEQLQPLVQQIVEQKNATLH